jgi:glycolate oxidase FAD binding subunit
MSLRDLLIGLQLMRADGTQAKAGGQVVKNVAGYDLMRLFCGSWGSLGLITSVTLRTLPLPPCRLLLKLKGPLAQLQQLRQDLLLRSPLALELLEWRQAEGAAAPSGAPWLELGLVSLNSSALNAQLEQLRQLLPASVRQEKLEECSLIAPVVPPDHWLLRLGVTPARIDQLLTQRQSGGWQLRLGAASGLGLAQAAFAATPAQRVEALRRSCEKLGGYLTVLQAPAQSKVAAWGDAPARPLIEAVKRQFDPLQQLARGRLPGVAASNH